MAAPILLEAEIKVDDQIILSFDQALDDSITVPLTSFSVNYGKIPIVAYRWYGNASIVLRLGRGMNAKDKLEVNYQPPEDPYKALSAPYPHGSSLVVVRRNVVRAFYKVPVRNLLRQDETAWNTDSNLGVNDDQYTDGDNPEFDGNVWRNECGDRIEPGAGGIGGIAVGGSTVQTNNTSRRDADGYQNYPIQGRPNPRSATPDDFILAYGLKEAIQITNMDNADAVQPNTDKLWMAIQDASALIDNYIDQASRGGKLLISSNRRRTALIIARYYLDAIRRREDVKQDYELAIKEIERATSMEALVRPDLPWWQDDCNPWRACGVRSHAIPQYYNGVSGQRPQWLVERYGLHRARRLPLQQA